ncbi:hypothetical protein C8Q80DRAFT_871044 [Daedaleopsis nitida]|nr:hypothetical protein C8Q80DRAFT_871044 [Daedaleopsis nitida]
MAPSNLQGLNIVHPIQPANPYLSDADLLSVPPFPDLNAQLDLWTNLNFQSDEPIVSTRPGEGLKNGVDSQRSTQDNSSEDDADRYNDPDEDLQRSEIAETHSHENVVMGTVLPPTGIVHPGHASTSVNASAPIPPTFDISSILAGFGIDPFMAPPPPMLQSASPASTIAQLLSLHAAARPGMGNPQPIPSSTRSTSTQSPVQPSQASSPATSTTKRARTSRGSVSSATESPEQADSPDDKDSSTPMNATEDKRRRNTAASARFRLKKKEREAALERKAKELEVRVSELEKECEALRRENGWLKGLVVGVTGAGAVQQQAQLQQQHQAPATLIEGAGTKRSRDEDA